MRRGITTRVAVVGGGVAALEFILALRKLADDRPQIHVIAPDRDFVYRPLAVAEPFGLATARHFDLGRLLAHYGAARMTAVVERVEPDAHRLVTAGGSEVGYDFLVIAMGAKPFEAVPAALTIAVGDGFARLKAALGRLATGDRVAVVVPPGNTWTLPAYELALMTTVAHPSARVAIVSPEEKPLAVFGDDASQEVAALLGERGIAFHAGASALAVEGRSLRLRGEAPLQADLVVALPGLRGPSLAGLPHDADGFIPVDGACRVEGVDDVYAAGDATNFAIKQGGLAAQQAVVAAKSIAAELGAPVTPREFEPVLRALLLTGGTPEYLRAELGGGEGPKGSEAAFDPIWWPPSKIATEHLSQVLALIAAAEPMPGEDPFLRVETDDVGHLLRPGN